jgi:hypothetical protein
LSNFGKAIYHFEGESRLDWAKISFSQEIVQAIQLFGSAEITQHGIFDLSASARTLA